VKAELGFVQKAASQPKFLVYRAVCVDAVQTAIAHCLKKGASMYIK